MQKFINDNSLGMRLARTILEAFIAFVLANVAAIAGLLSSDPAVVSLTAAFITCVLSPVLAVLQKDEATPADQTQPQ